MAEREDAAESMNQRGLSLKQILAWRNGALTPSDSPVVAEEALEVCVEGKTAGVLMRTPGLDKELAVGYCLGEGVVPSMDLVSMVRHCGEGDLPDMGEPAPEARNRVQISVSDPSAVRLPDEVARLVRSGCGRTNPSTLAEGIEPVPVETLFNERVLRDAVRGLAGSQDKYRIAGGIHAAAVGAGDGSVVVVCEDVGRHNAVDKALGYCALRGIATWDKFLVSTGRASYEMVTKAARLHVPLVASLSSPTSLAVDLAVRLNVTLLGYLRADRFTVYAHAARITGLPQAAG
jgi:FdhD protein